MPDTKSPENFSAPDGCRIAEPELSRLNAALYRAQARQAQAEAAQAKLDLAIREAQLAADAFLAVRFRLSQSLKVANLGVTHGWDTETGEVRPIEQK